MKKVIILAAAMCPLFYTSCNSCGSQPNGVAIESDSLFMINDSTMGDLQTFVFEGTTPMKNGNIGDVIVTMSTVSLNDDGTYTITTDYIDEALATESDNGEMLVLIGMPNDSTAIVYEFISANGNPKMNFMLDSDTSLVKLNDKMQPVSKNSAHKLFHKKQ
jgi:copper homeostasis protein (lipoprotein)